MQCVPGVHEHRERLVSLRCGLQPRRSLCQRGSQGTHGRLGTGRFSEDLVVLFGKNLSNAISRSCTESQGRAFVIVVDFVIDPRGKNVPMNGITVISKSQKQGVIGIDLGLILNEYSGQMCYGCLVLK